MSTRLVFCMVAILAALPAWPSPTETATSKCVVEGIVWSGSTGQPLGKAHVTLRGIDNSSRVYAADTEPDGRFLLKNIEPGRYRLSVTRTGYVPQEYGQRSFGQSGSPLVLDSGQHLSELIVRMVATGVLTGHILDAHGEPLAGVQVRAMRRTFQPGQSHFAPVGSAATNDQGEYRIWGLQPGRYFLSALYSVAVDPSGIMITLPTAHGESGQTREESYAPTYYPGAIDLAQAAPIELGPGEERSAIDFTMTITPLVRLRGRVLNMLNPRDMRGISVELKSRTEGAGLALVNTATTNDQGNFEMRGVVPGSYHLTALWNDGRKQHFARQAIEVSNSDTDGVTLIIAAGINLSGHVHIEHGTPINLTSLRVDLHSRDDLPVLGGSLVPVRPDGSFVLSDIPEGVFDVYLFGPPDAMYLKSVRYGGQETLDSGLIIRRGQPVNTLELELGQSNAQIDGLVLDDEKLPVSGAQVVIVPEGDRSARTDFYKTATSDQLGHFHLAKVPPGSYKLFAWGDIESGAYLDAGFRQPFEDRATQLAIQDMGHYDAELTLISVPKT